MEGGWGMEMDVLLWVGVGVELELFCLLEEGQNYHSGCFLSSSS